MCTPQRQSNAEDEYHYNYSTRLRPVSKVDEATTTKERRLRLLSMQLQHKESKLSLGEAETNDRPRNSGIYKKISVSLSGSFRNSNKQQGCANSEEVLVPSRSKSSNAHEVRRPQSRTLAPSPNDSSPMCSDSSVGSRAQSTVGSPKFSGYMTARQGRRNISRSPRAAYPNNQADSISQSLPHHTNGSRRSPRSPPRRQTRTPKAA